MVRSPTILTKWFVVTKMEASLNSCPVCGKTYKNPILLDCFHSICRTCIHTSQQTKSKPDIPPDAYDSTQSQAADDKEVNTHSKGITQPVNENKIREDIQSEDDIQSENQDKTEAKPQEHMTSENHNVNIQEEESEYPSSDTKPTEPKLSKPDLEPNKEVNMSTICPICRYVTHVKSPGRADYFLDRYIQVLGVPLTIGAVCGDCGLGHIADYGENLYCMECKISLCDACKSSHHVDSKTEKHTITNSVLALEEAFLRMKKETSKCDIHDEDLLYYCMKCSTQACMNCIVDYHSKHWSVSLPKALSHKKNEIKSTAAELKSYHTNTHRLVEALPNYYHHEADKLKKRVKSDFGKLVELVNETEKKLLNDIDKSVEGTLTQLEECREETKQTCMVATSALSRLHMINRYGSEGDLLHHHSMIKESKTWPVITSDNIQFINAISIPNLENITETVQQVLHNINIEVTQKTLRHKKSSIMKHVPRNLNCEKSETEDENEQNVNNEINHHVEQEGLTTAQEITKRQTRSTTDDVGLTESRTSFLVQ